MAFRSSSESGPSGKSLGRTNSPSEEAMRRALSPSSSMTRVSHWTADFSALP